MSENKVMYVLIGQDYDDVQVLFVSDTKEKIEQKQLEYKKLHKQVIDWTTIYHRDRQHKFPVGSQSTLEEFKQWDTNYKIINTPPTLEYTYGYTMIQEVELI